jgi:hypothetical protein
MMSTLTFVFAKFFEINLENFFQIVNKIKKTLVIIKNFTYN